MSAPPHQKVLHRWPPKAFTASKRPFEARAVCPDREAIIRALDDAPPGLEEIRALLLRKHVGRVRDGHFFPSPRLWPLRRGYLRHTTPTRARCLTGPDAR